MKTARPQNDPDRQPDASLTRAVGDGLHVVRLRHGGLTELFVTAIPANGDSLGEMFARALSAVREAGAVVCRQDVFGTPALRGLAERALTDACGEVDWPVTWLEEGAGGGARLVGTHVHAVAGVPVRRVHLAGRVVGSVYQNSSARCCHLGDIRPVDTSRPREEQASAMFDQMKTALELAGMSFADLIRTWLYVDEILAWYGQLNRARDAFFRRHNVFDGLVPASTGVGGSNLAGAAVVANAMAVEPLGSGVKIVAVPSPLQCPAPEYGSSFSRAVEVQAPDHRRLYVSGTASIEPGGATAHIGDVQKQIALTMRVVRAILESRGMGWADTTRAIAYIKHAEYGPMFAAHCAAGGLPPLPVVIAQNHICREDLLFEIEVDAIVTGGTAKTASSHLQERV